MLFMQSSISTYVSWKCELSVAYILSVSFLLASFTVGKLLFQNNTLILKIISHFWWPLLRGNSLGLWKKDKNIIKNSQMDALCYKRKVQCGTVMMIILIKVMGKGHIKVYRMYIEKISSAEGSDYPLVVVT